MLGLSLGCAQVKVKCKPLVVTKVVRLLFEPASPCLRYDLNSKP